jgi:archaeosortase B (VPXXXP-CTERM-specific)
MSEAQRFGLRFFAVLGGFSVLAWIVALPQQLGVAQRTIAEAAGALARVAGSTNRVHGDQIHVTQLAIHINHECTGIYVLIILFTFLLAYPAAWRQRLLGATVGFAGLEAVNVLRLSFLIRIAELQPALFEYFHEYVWQGVLLILVIAYSMSWVEHVR